MDCANHKEHLKSFAMGIPKAELHLHVEGTFEPELMFEIAQRNNVSLPYKSAAEIKEKYNFSNLQDFLDIYYEACSVLKKEEDFRDLAYAYFKKAHTQGLKYVEMFFDPQTHTKNSLPITIVVNGLKQAIVDAKRNLDIEAQLVPCFLRHLSEEDAFETLEDLTPYKSDSFVAFGLDSSEVGHPPSKFKNVFKSVKDLGLKVCCHAGEEGPSAYIKEAIEELDIDRIDHGIRITEDEELMKLVADRQIPLTLCPLSNEKLKAFPDLSKYELRRMIDIGLLVCLNSDDPAYFGGYVGENYTVLIEKIGLTKEEIILLAKNSFRATFLTEAAKKVYIDQVDEYVVKNSIKEITN